MLTSQLPSQLQPQLQCGGRGSGLAAEAEQHRADAGARAAAGQQQGDSEEVGAGRLWVLLPRGRGYHVPPGTTACMRAGRQAGVQSSAGVRMWVVAAWWKGCPARYHGTAYGNATEAGRQAGTARGARRRRQRHLAADAAEISFARFHSHTCPVKQQPEA